MGSLRIDNGKLVLKTRVIDRGYVEVADGIIVGYGSGESEFPADEIIDAQGMYVAPGFVDIHLHGGGDNDYMDGTVEAFFGAAKAHARYGTTSMFPTTLSGDLDELKAVLSLYDQAASQPACGGAELLGIHLEGPCFSYDEKGAQDPRYLVEPKDLPYKEMLGWSKHIKRWDIAPELAGGMEMGGWLVSRGVRASIGHSSASYRDCNQAFDNGFNILTHFYACMTSIHRMGKASGAGSGAGAIEAGYANKDMYVELIADGAHLKPEAVQAIYRIKGPERTLFITDAMRAAASDLTESVLGSKSKGQPVYIDPEFGVARLKDTGVWAGSAATMQRLVRVAHVDGGIPIHDTIRMAATTPAEAMGVNHRKGSIGLYKDADLVIFNETVDIHHVILKGAVIPGVDSPFMGE